MSIDRSVIEKRITELEKERDAFVQQANAQIASYHGAIAALKALLALNEQAETDDKKNSNGEKHDV